MAFLEDIRNAWKTGRSLSDIKAARDYFAEQEDLDAFFASGWSIQDVKEFKEMVETKPNPEQKQEVDNNTGIEVPKPEAPTESIFKKLAEREDNR